MGIPGNVFESLPAREGPSSAFFENSRNLASSSCGLGPGNTGHIMEHWKRGETRSAEFLIPTPCFTQGLGTLTPFVLH